MLKFTGSVDGRLRSAEQDGEKERMQTGDAISRLEHRVNML